MSRATITRHLIPEQGTVERRLLVDVLARMAKVWLDAQRREHKDRPRAADVAGTQAQTQAGQEAAL